MSRLVLLIPTVLERRRWILSVLLSSLCYFVYADNNHYTEPEDDEEEECEECAPKCESSNCGDPFLLYNGEFYLNERFLEQESGSLGTEFYLNFHYRTYFETLTPVGFGWIHNFHQRLRETNRGGLIMINHKSYEVNFESDGIGGYVSLDTRDLRAVFDTDLQRYVVSKPDGSQRIFHPEGYLTKWIAADGSYLELTYEGKDTDPNTPEAKVVVAIPHYSNLEVPSTVIRDFRVVSVAEFLPSGQETGREFSFTYNPESGMLDQVSDQSGRSVTLTHEPEDYEDPANPGALLTSTNGFLSSFQNGDGIKSDYTYYHGTIPSTRKYDYGYMNTFTQVGCRDCTTRTNYYQSDGRISRQDQGGNGMTGESISVSYNENGTTLTVTVTTTIRTYAPGDEIILGSKTRRETVVFNTNVYGKPTIVSRSTQGQVGSEQFLYYDQLADFDDPSEVGRKGKVKQYTKSDGSHELYDYYPDGMIKWVKRLVSNGVYHTTEFTYGSSDQGSHVTSETVYLSDSPGVQFITEYDYQGGTNLLTHVKRKKADGSFAVTEQQYHPAGLHEGLVSQRIAHNGANTRRTNYEYTGVADLPQPVGLLKREYDADDPAIETQYVYDSIGRVVLMVEPNGLETHSIYDESNNLLTETLKDSSNATLFVTGNTLVNNRLTEKKTGNSSDGFRYTRHSYDLFGKRFRTEQIAKDEGGNVTGALKSNEILSMDTEGNIYIEEDDIGRVVTRDFDVLGRLVSEREPYNGVSDSVTTYSYEDSSREVQLTTDPVGRNTFTEYNHIGQLVVSREGYDTDTTEALRVRYYVHDAIGNVIQERITGPNPADPANPSEASIYYYYDRLGRKVGVNWDPANPAPDPGGARELPMKYAFDDQGNLVASTDGRGFMTQYEFDQFGRQTRMIPPDSGNYPSGNETTFAYDRVGQLVSISDGRGIRRFFHYDVQGRQTHGSVETDADLSGENWWLDATKVAQALVYNAWGEVTEITYSTGKKREVEYDSLGREGSTTENDTFRTRNNYRNLEQVSSVDFEEVGPSGQVTTRGSAAMTYSDVNPRMLLNSVDPEGRETGFVYGLDFRRVKTVDYLNHPGGGNDLSGAPGTVATYDGLGRFQSITRANGDTTWFEFDVFDQLVITYLPPHFAVRNAPDSGDPTGRQVQTYTPYSQVESQVGEQNYSVQNTYDLAGNRITLTDNKNQGGGSVFSGGSTTKWTYDERGRVTRKDYDYNMSNGNSQNSYSYTYDEIGQLKSRTDGNGRTTNYNYRTDRNLIDSVDYPSDRDIRYQYFANVPLVQSIQRLDDLTQPGTATNEASFTYDGYGRPDLVLQHYVHWLVDYDYDASGRKVSRKIRPIGTSAGHPQERVASFSYDNLNRIVSVTDDQFSSNSFNIQYPSVAVSAQSVSMPHGQKQRLIYDPLSERVVSANFHFGDGVGAHGTLMSGYGYSSYNPMGQIEEVEYSGTAFTSRHPSQALRPHETAYGYNSAGEVVASDTVNDTAGAIEQRSRGYSFDAIGNRETSDEGGNVSNYTANGLNEYGAIETQSLNYDENGSLTQFGSSASYVWNDENRLVRVTTETKKVEYEYNSIGQQIERREFSSPTAPTPTKTTRFFLDQWNVVAEFEGAGTSPSVTYAWGPDLSRSEQGAGGVGGFLGVSDSSGIYYPAYDGNGNVTGYCRSDDVMCAHFEYDPFGKSLHEWSLLDKYFRYRFSTKPFDEVAQAYYYGLRYYSPYLGRWLSRDPILEDGGLNLYAFLYNNPVGDFDILGRESGGETPTRGIGKVFVDRIQGYMKPIGGLFQQGVNAVKSSFTQFRKNARSRASFTSDSRRELANIGIFKLRAGGVLRVESDGCCVKVKGGPTLALSANGLPPISIAGGVTVTGSAAYKYCWFDGKEEWSGSISGTGWIGVRIGLSSWVVDAFAEGGVYVNYTYSFTTGNDKIGVGGYVRAVFQSKGIWTKRRQYKYTFGDPDVNF